MLRQMTALILALILVATATPVALAASESYSARTPLSGSGIDKLNNLSLATQAIDGTTVPSGESFSFNDVVGPREKRRGYREARNGRGVTVTGGGVAQAATTLYIALLQMGNAVDIDPIKTYGARFTDDYVQDPSLAVVTDYDAGIDLSFTNMTDDLVIDMWLGDDDLWCVITVGQGAGSGSRPGSGGNQLFPDEGQDANDDASEATPGFWIPVDPDDGDDDASQTNPGFWTSDDPDDGDDEPEPPYEFDLYDGDDGDETSGSNMLPGTGFDGGSQAETLGSSAIYCGGDANVLHNVTLAADSLNDTVLESGDRFSFNDVVGPRTNKYGYLRAINGRGARVTGGGVAQVASALWLAVKDMDDIEILEKSTYGSRYNQHYVYDSADAILTDYASGRDFRFRYIGDSSITIYAYVDDGWLYCDVVGD